MMPKHSEAIKKKEMSKKCQRKVIIIFKYGLNDVYNTLNINYLQFCHVLRKCFTKKLCVIEYSLILLILKLNGELPVFNW